MTAANPGNVPKVTDVRWSYGPKEASTIYQRERLRELIEWEGIRPAEFVGEGFLTIDDLSKWSAHWGISTLESAQLARQIEADRREVEERVEQRAKAAFAEILRTKYPHLRRRYG